MTDTATTPYAGLTNVASLQNGRYVDNASGLPAFYGPNGEPAYPSQASAPAGAQEATMPDGTQVWYMPGNLSYAAGGTDQAWSSGQAVPVSGGSQPNSWAGLGAVATMTNGRYTDTATGQPAYYGPDGEPGYPTNPGIPGAVQATMPDGTPVWYVPGNLSYASPTRAPDTAWGQGAATSQSAISIIDQTLQQYGLQGLANWAWNEVTQGASTNQVLIDLQNQPAFKQRFPGIAIRQQQGLPAISPADYITYEDQAKQLENQYGLPSGFLSDPNRIGNLIGNDVSMSELSARVQDGFAKIAYAPPEVQQAFGQMFGAYGPGALASMALDTKTAEPLLAQMATAADIAGHAQDVGFGLGNGMDQNTAMRLAQMGVTANSAQSQLSDLAAKQGLFSQQVGEATGLTKQQGVQAEFGLSADATRAMQQETEMRQAEFAGGGGPNVTSQGTSIGAAKPF